MIVNHNAPVIYCGYCYSTNYYHWMYDSFPAALWLRKFRPEYINHPIAVPKSAINASHVIGWGKLINAKYVECEEDDESNKVVVRWQGRHTLGPHLNVISLYRDFIPPRITPTRHLMIARRCRQILNADAVMGLFKEKGINLEQVYFEEHSIMDQIVMAASAKTIIGIHGAGLANITYCSPGTKVVEVFHPIYCHQYEFMSGGMGFHYRLVDSKLMDEWGNVTVDPLAVFSAWESL